MVVVYDWGCVFCGFHDYDKDLFLGDVTGVSGLDIKI